MGLHSARRSHGATSAVAGRSVITAAAAFAILGGGTGMAFAGEATDAASSSDSGHGDHDGHGKGHDGHWGGHDKDHKKHDCKISVVDPASEGVDNTVNGATDDATKDILDEGNHTIDPLHDAICPPVDDVVDNLTGTGDDDGSDTAGKSDSKDDSDKGSTPLGGILTSA